MTHRPRGSRCPSRFVAYGLMPNQRGSLEPTAEAELDGSKAELGLAADRPRWLHTLHLCGQGPSSNAGCCGNLWGTK